MNDTVTLRRLRRFLSLLSAALFVGTVVELLAVEHHDGWQQDIPSVLRGLGLLVLLLGWRQPSRAMVLALRAVTATVVLGSLLRVYFHVEGNLGFAREIDPDAGGWTLLRETFTGGNPIGASAILIVGAALATAATYATGVQAAADRGAPVGRPDARGAAAPPRAVG